MNTTTQEKTTVRDYSKDWEEYAKLLATQLKVILSDDMQLLYDDMKARIPYGLRAIGVTAIYDVLDTNLPSVLFTVCSLKWNSPTTKDVHSLRPFLFPISSLNEELRKEMESIDPIAEQEKLIEFYLKNHIDYQNLIEKELAVDATDKHIYD